jgi:hypothetical protein
MAKAHGNVKAHGNGATAHGNDIKARQRPLPCEFGTAHGKECVAVRYTAVRSLSCVHAGQSLCRAFWPICRVGMVHGKALFSGSDGKEAGHGKISTSRTALFHARQSLTMTHGKDSRHGKKQKRRTAKNSARQRRTPLPCMATMPCATVTNTAKEPLPCGSPLPCVILAFSFFFIYVLFFLLLMFISQLVLYFVDYLLVLYPCFLQYNIL